MTGIAPAFRLKSKEVRMTYRRTNGRKYVDAGELDELGDLDDADDLRDMDEPHVDSVQPLDA
jgi:hypothetical protein